MDLKERFLKYVSFDTRSDETSETFPSTEKQLVLLRYLKEELETIGLKEVTMDEYGYVICAEDKELPDLDGFAPTGALVCTNTEAAVSIGDIKDGATLSSLVDLYINGKGVTFENTAVETLAIKFTSEKYPHLYFNLSVMIEEDESVYLWNRDSGRYVNVGDLLDQYIEGYLY
jgi:hypothetical protein